MTSTTSSRAPSDARGSSRVGSRPKKLLITSHCVLNQNAVVQPLARSTGVMQDATKWAVENGFTLFQLPCPEFRFAGPNRPSGSFEDYNTPDFHASNAELLTAVIAKIVQYRDAGWQIVGGLHIQGSPCCDPRSGNWITDFLSAAADANIDIEQLWQIPQTSTGAFDPGDPATSFGSPDSRKPLPVVIAGPSLSIRTNEEY